MARKAASVPTRVQPHAGICLVYVFGRCACGCACAYVCLTMGVCSCAHSAAC